MDQIVGITNTLYPGTKPLFKLAGGGGGMFKGKKRLLFTSHNILPPIVFCKFN